MDYVDLRGKNIPGIKKARAKAGACLACFRNNEKASG